MKSNTRDVHTILREQVVPAGTNRYGVVIGIEEYLDARLHLRCARADAEAMYELMIEPDCGMLKSQHHSTFHSLKNS